MRAVSILAGLLAAFYCPAALGVTFQWSNVGNPMNDADDTGVGRVAHAYRISKYEVTNGQYVEFLNAVDPTGQNSLELYSSLMSSGTMGGILRDSVAENGSKYKTKQGRESNPVVYVSFFDAMRFVNWLANGQGDATTESGVYVIDNGLSEVRATNAKYFLPTDNEWYKAAFHKNDGVTGNYWDYPTSSDARPYSDSPASFDAPDLTNVANFKNSDGLTNGFNDGFALTGVATFENTVNYLTDVGAYAEAVSPYGTFDQAGNVWEWVEGVNRGRDNILRRVVRGGSWDYGASALHVTVPGTADLPAIQDFNIGFRVASVPEPTSVASALLAAQMVLSTARTRDRSSLA